MTQPTDFIEQLAALAEKATPGDWEVSWSSIIVAGSGARVGYPPVDGCIASLDDGEYIENNNAHNDAALIVLLRNNVDAIIALGRERDALRRALDLIATVNPAVTSLPVLQEVARQALEGDNQ